MYPVSNAFAQAITSDARTFVSRITFISSSDELTGETIQDITLDELSTTGDTITMGSACSNKVTINLVNPPINIDYDGAKFRVEEGLKLEDGTIEYVPLGEFYSTEVETRNDFRTLNIVAYDGFSQMNGAYVPGRTISTLQDLYDDLQLQLKSECNITLKDYVPIHLEDLSAFAFTDFQYVEDATFHESVAYLAGCLGGFARFARDGRLEIVWYTDTEVRIERRMQYLNGFKRTTDKALTITALSTGTSEEPIAVGDGDNGTAIKFENPYITEEIATAIYESVKGKSYVPCDIKWRGNPAIQAGDVVQVVDKDDSIYIAYVMQHSIKISGGCSQETSCKGLSDTEAAFSNSFETTSQKLDRVYKTLQTAILNATSMITGNKGGYVVMHDSNGDGKPDEILIMDAEEIENAVNVWRWNNQGLGFSKTGYEGPYGLAMTIDGQINADFITTGHLSAERILVGNGLLSDYVTINPGVVTIGGQDSKIVWEMENDQVAFIDTTNASEPVETWVATPNSFEIKNLKGGRIRFQNFAWYPRENGNLTFTRIKD